MPSVTGDPIHQDDKDQLWYFWDETWADRNGPYGSREAAEAALTRYTQYLDRCSKLTRELPSGIKPGACCGHDYDCIQCCGNPMRQKTTTENLSTFILIVGGSAVSACVVFVFMYGAVQLAKRFGWLL